jgi:AraC-like DNA-binding protein
MQRDTASIAQEIVMLLCSNPQLTLKDIACVVAVDRHSIQKAIREQYRCSFRYLQNQIRLSYVRSLLREEHCRYCIKEIAESMGITPNALSRFVKTMTGHYPTELRSLKW